MKDLLRRLLSIPDGHEGRAARLIAMIFMMSAATVLLKAAQSGLFLEAYPRSAIPWAFAVSAVTLATASSLCVSLSPRLGPARLASASLLVMIAILLGLRVCLLSHAAPVRFLTYVLIDASLGVMIVQVWSTAAAACDARTARRLLPIAGLGAGTAWTIGGFTVPVLTKWIGAEELLLIAPVLLVGTFVTLRRVVALDVDPHARRGRRRQGLIAAWKEGFRFVAREPLMRLAAGLAMLALLTEQFMDFTLMATAREELGDAEAISGFFGTFYGVTSAVGLVLLAGVSGRLLATLGATRSLLVTPIAVGIAAVFAVAMPSLLTAVILRGVGRVLKQSIASSAAEQMQTPLPNVRRSQARAAIRGVLAPAAYGVCAIGLAFVPDHVDTRWLALLAVGTTSITALLVFTKARSVYHDALHRAVDERRILLGPGRSPSGANLDADACRALAEELQSEDVERAALAAEMLGSSEGSHGADAVVAALSSGLEHPAAAVRLAVVRALGRLSPAVLEASLRERLTLEDDVDVRRAIVATLRALPTRTQETSALFERIADGEGAEAVLARIATIEHTTEAEVRGASLLPLLKDPSSLKVALSALDLGATRAPGVQSQLSRWLECGEPEPQLAVARTVVRLGLAPLLPDVVRLLKDPRTAPTAARYLVTIDSVTEGPRAGEETLGASLSHLAHRASSASKDVTEAIVLRLLQHPEVAIRRHAVEALGVAVRRGERDPLEARAVAPLIGSDVRRAYQLYSLLGGLAHDDGVPDWEVEPEFELLAHELDLEIERARRDVLGLLVLTGRKNLVGAVEVGRRVRSTARDAQVAELLELGLDRELARTVVPLFERLTLRERVGVARRLGVLDEEAVQSPLDAIVALGDAHLRRCAQLTYGVRFERRFPEIAQRDATMVPLYERMRFLRSVPLFRELSSDDVLQLAEKVEQVEHTEGDVVFLAGDPGEDLFFVIRGRVAIMDGEVALAEMGEREFFGELALLDHQARSADAVCREDTSLLRLRGADLEELMARRPAAMREIVRVLARRLRTTGRRIAE